MTKQPASSEKQRINNGSVCYKCRITFNNSSSITKHHDRGSRACAPRPAGVVHVDAPGMSMLPVTSAYATDICPVPAPALGQEMSLFAAALEAQDGISSRSKESEDDCKPDAICQDDKATGHNSTATVGDDEAAGHNSMATIGDAVPASRYMAWLDGEPDLFAMEDQFFLCVDVKDVVDHEDDNLSVQSGKSNSTEHFNFAPLPTSGNPIDVQDTAPEYIHHYQAAKFKDIKVDSTLHNTQEELMHHIKNTQFSFWAVW
jgi:hypothetical protein